MICRAFKCYFSPISYLKNAIILPISLYLASLLFIYSFIHLFIYLFIMKGSILFWYLIRSGAVHDPLTPMLWAYDKEAYCGWSMWHRKHTHLITVKYSRGRGKPENQLQLLLVQQKWPQDLPWVPPLGIPTSSTQ